MERILVVEDCDALRDVLKRLLAREGHQVHTCDTAEKALESISTEDYTLVFSDLKLPGKSGIDFLSELREHDHSTPVVLMTAYGDIQTAVHAMKLGATTFITKPFEPDTILNLVLQVSKHRELLDCSVDKRPVITENKAFQEILEQARKVAPLDSPVLLLGESGTGKELVARYIHQHSARSDEAFIPVNCASMPDELLESEFFGHEAGAFTGAFEARDGFFEMAHHGTILLDEIGTMPTRLQTKLLRTLQESEIKKLGGTKVQRIDVRIISATNCEIEQEISAKNFREDLYYRLSVLTLEIPPLRKRPEDIPLLAEFFIKQFAEKFHKKPPALTAAVIKKLQTHHWPGNVRELENVIERAMVFGEGRLTPEQLELGHNKVSRPDSILELNLPAAVREAVLKTEQALIGKALEQCGGNKLKASKLLGVSYKTLINKTKDLDPSKNPH